MRFGWLRSSPYDRSIFSLAIPAFGAQIADPLVSVVDTAFVGHLNSEALAALGINASIFALAFYVFSFLSSGTTTLVAHALGNNQVQESGKTVTAALWLAVSIGLLMCGLLWLLAEPILAGMGAQSGLVGLAKSYLVVRAMAAPAVLIMFVGHGAFRGFLDTRTPLVIVIAVNIINAILNAIFIFPLGFGVQGSAMGTLIAQWVGGIWFLILFWRRRAQYHTHFFKPDWDALKRLMRVGRDLSVRSVSLLTAVAMAAAVSTRIGVIAIAGHQIILETWWFLALALDALGISGQAVVARYVGQNDWHQAKLAANRALQLAFMFGFLMSGVTLLAGHAIPRVFTDDPQVIEIVAGVFPIIALMQPINAVVFVWDGIYLGVGQFRFLAKMMAGSAAITLITLPLVIPLGLGLRGVWSCFVLLYLMRCAIFSRRYFFNPLREL